VAIWLHSPDPAFREKVNVICNLYRKAPAGSVVLSIDEKTGMQAISRKHLDRPPRPPLVDACLDMYRRALAQGLGDEDMVAVQTQLLNDRNRPNDGGLRQVHLFRFEGDMIAEYWDITQLVTSDMPNADGAF